MDRFLSSSVDLGNFLLDQRKNTNGAIEMYRKAESMVKSNPKNVKPDQVYRIYEALSRGEAVRGNVVESAKLFELGAASAISSKTQEVLKARAVQADQLRQIGKKRRELKDYSGAVWAAEKEWQAREEILKEVPDNTNKDNVAYATAILAWSRILNGNPQQAADAAGRGLEVAVSKHYVCWNSAELGHARLLMGRASEALELYRGCKDQRLNPTLTYGDVIVGELTDIQNAGIPGPNIEKMKTILLGLK